jgi:multisubunit Na+/H+ antiporter MnhC subunit
MMSVLVLTALIISCGAVGYILGRIDRDRGKNETARTKKNC